MPTFNELITAASTYGPSIPSSRTPILITRGAVADVWLVQAQGSQFINKVLRVGPECFQNPRGYIGDEGPEYSESSEAQFTRDLRAKVDQWVTLQHRNVVRVFGIGEKLEVRVEFCANATARQYLRKHNYDSDIRKLMIQDVLRGVNYLHSHDPPIVHGSLNAGKLFVAEDGTCKIGEFGLSPLTMSFALLAPYIWSTQLGRWTSPELIDLNPDDGDPILTTASDVWALGCILLEIITGEIPYSRYKHELRVRGAVLRGEPPGVLASETGEQFDALWPIMARCWEQSPGDRPSVDAIQRGIHQVLGITVPSAFTGTHTSYSDRSCSTDPPYPPNLASSQPPGPSQVWSAEDSETKRLNQVRTEEKVGCTSALDTSLRR